jgi:hypothetical protein
MEESCCTCATLLSEVPRFRRLASDPPRDRGGADDRPSVQPSDKFPEEYSEKGVPLPSDRRLPCCARVICGDCLDVRGARWDSTQIDFHKWEKPLLS